MKPRLLFCFSDFVFRSAGTTRLGCVVASASLRERERRIQILLKQSCFSCSSLQGTLTREKRGEIPVVIAADCLAVPVFSEPRRAFPLSGTEARSRLVF